MNNSATSKSVDLDALLSTLRQQIECLTQAALQSGTIPTESDIQGVERLKRLIDLSANINPQKPAVRERRYLLELLLGMLSLVLVLLLVHKQTVQVDLDLAVSGLSFVQEREQQVSGPVALSSLGANSYASMDTPRTIDDPNPVSLPPPVRFQEVAGNPGGLTLAPLTLPTGALIEFQRGPSSDQYMLYIMGEKPEVVASIWGAIRVDTADNDQNVRNFGRPKPLQIRGDPAPVELQLDLGSHGREVFRPQILVRNVAFKQSIDRVIDGRMTPGVVSSIVGGTIYNDSLNGRKYDLRMGEWLNFTGSHGEVRSLLLKDDGIHLSFHGWVEGMTVGSDDNRHSLMPSYLDWLSERHGLALFWTALGWSFALAMGVIRWWRDPLQR